MPRPTAAGKTGQKVRHLNLPFSVPADADLATENAALVAAVEKEFARRGLVYGQPLPSPAASQPTLTWRASQPPSPAGCTTEVELLACMRRLRKWAGNPSYGQLQKRAAEAGRKLPHSTIARALAEGNTRLPGHEKLTAFVLACGVTEHQWREWSAAWDKVLYFGSMPDHLRTLAKRVIPNGARYPGGYRTVLAPADDVDLVVLPAA